MKILACMRCFIRPFFGVMIIFLSMNVQADGIGKGLESDVSLRVLSHGEASMPKGASSSEEKFLSMPEGLPANPQCLSGGQPCAEEAQKEADDFKAARQPK